jgi:hypothetical protein
MACGKKAVLGGLTRFWPTDRFSSPKPSCMMDGLASLFHNYPRNSVLRCGGVLDPLLPRGLFPLGENQDALAEARHRRFPADVVYRDRDLPGHFSGERSSYPLPSALSGGKLTGSSW